MVLAKGIGPKTGDKLVDAMGSASAAIGADIDALVKVGGMTLKSATKVRGAIKTVLDEKAHEQEYEIVAKHGARLVCVWDHDYPRLMRPVTGRPRILWVKGEMQVRDAVSLAVVGARKCSTYGREQAARFAGQVAAAGVCVVSGGAKGIDSAAHWAALQAGGRTIAVLGSGLGKPYPKDNIELFGKIVHEQGGSVMSEYPMMRGPQAENFPARNRIIAAMTMGTLVVEAAKRSGALITARQANEMGREVMAVPGRVDSAVSGGCHEMIKGGWAQMVTSGAEVLDVMMEQEMVLQGGDEVLAGQLEKDGLSSGDMDGKSLDEMGGTVEEQVVGVIEQGYSESQRLVLVMLEGGGRSFDELVAMTELEAGVLQGELTMLEIRGAVKRAGGGVYQRKS